MIIGLFAEHMARSFGATDPRFMVVREGQVCIGFTQAHWAAVAKFCSLYANDLMFVNNSESECRLYRCVKDVAKQVEADTYIGTVLAFGVDMSVYYETIEGVGLLICSVTFAVKVKADFDSEFEKMVSYFNAEIASFSKLGGDAADYASAMRGLTVAYSN